jgi:glutaredoxin-related protein
VCALKASPTKHACAHLQAFSNWPTFPQLYVKGDLIGGCDIVLEMHRSGELAKTFAEAQAENKTDLNRHLKQLVHSAPIVLFMKVHRRGCGAFAVRRMNC